MAGTTEHAAPTKWRNRIVRFGYIDPHELLAHPDNWRIHPTLQKLAVKDSLEELGWIDAVTLQHGTDIVVDGHLRAASALEAGETAVPAIWVDLDDDEVKKALVLFDTTTGLAGTDQAKLDALIAEVQTDSAALARLLDSLSSAAKGEGGDAEEPEIVFTRELLEAQHYVVFAFDNEFDWNVVVEAFGIGPVHSLDSRPGYERKGIGRVLDGQKLLEVLHGAHRDPQ